MMELHVHAHHVALFGVFDVHVCNGWCIMHVHVHTMYSVGTCICPVGIISARGCVFGLFYWM